MQRNFYQIASAPDPTNLQCFFVFDGAMPVAEGSQPVIFFSSVPSDITKPHYEVNSVGILLTFINFVTRFSTDDPCDYIRTSAHETALLELDNNVWMSVQRQTSPSLPSNRNLLHSMLLSCKSIYKLFFPPIERQQMSSNIKKVTRESTNIIKSAFEMIVNSITWADLGFIHLFDSFFQLKLDDTFSSELCPIIHRLLNSEVPIAHIAIMYSRYFIFYTFPTDVARTLSICLRMKLPYLFPRVLAKEDEKLYWIIGMSETERKSLAIYAPPLFIDGRTYPLVGLRIKKLRFFLTLQSHVLPSPSLLSSIPPLLKPLRRHCEKLKLDSKKNTSSKIFNTKSFSSKNFTSPKNSDTNNFPLLKNPDTNNIASSNNPAIKSSNNTRRNTKGGLMGNNMKGGLQSPYVVLKNLPQEKMLALSHEKLSDTMIPIAENMIFQGHTFASNVARLRATVAFPGPAGLGYYIFLRKTAAEEVVVMCQNESKEVTQAAGTSYMLEQPENVKWPQIVTT